MPPDTRLDPFIWFTDKSWSLLNPCSGKVLATDTERETERWRLRLRLYLLRRHLLLQIHRAESAYLKYTASPRQLRTAQTSTQIYVCLALCGKYWAHMLTSHSCWYQETAGNAQRMIDSMYKRTLSERAWLGCFPLLSWWCNWWPFREIGSFLCFSFLEGQTTSFSLNVSYSETVSEFYLLV